MRPGPETVCVFFLVVFWLVCVRSKVEDRSKHVFKFRLKTLIMHYVLRISIPWVSFKGHSLIFVSLLIQGI